MNDKPCNMPAIIRLQKTLARTALAAILIALVTPGCHTTVPTGGDSPASAEAELKRITEFPITIRPSPRMARDISLPLICQTVVDAIRSAVADPETKERLGHLVREVVIKE